MLLSSHPEITHPGSPRVSYRPRNPPPKARKSRAILRTQKVAPCHQMYGCKICTRTLLGRPTEWDVVPPLIRAVRCPRKEPIRVKRVCVRPVSITPMDHVRTHNVPNALLKLRHAEI